MEMSNLSLPIFGSVLMLCVIVPPALFHFLSQRGADNDLRAQNKNHQEIINILNEIKNGHSQQMNQVLSEINQLSSRGNNLFDNVEDVIKVVKVMEQKQEAGEALINTRFNSLEAQVYRGEQNNAQYLEHHRDEQQQHFLQNVEHQTKEHLCATDCSVDEIRAMANSLQTAPENSLLFRIGSALVEAIPQ